MAGQTSTGFWSRLAQLYRHVQPASRRQIWVLALLTAAGAMSEVVAIGSVVPFLALLADTSFRERIPLAAKVFSALGAETRSEQLVLATLILCAAALASGLFRIFLVRMSQDFAYSFGHRLTVEIQRRMLLQPYAWQVRHNSSEQLATIEKAEVVTSGVVLPLVQAVASSLLIVVILAVLLKIAPLATVIAAIALGAAYYMLGAFARKRLNTNSDQLDVGFGQRIRILQEGLAGIRDVILDGSQATVLNRYRAVDFQLARTRANSAFIATVPRYLIEPVGIIIIAILALSLANRSGGLMAALPVLGALAVGAQRLLPLVQQLFQGWSSVAANRSLIDDVLCRLQLTLPPAAETGRRLPFEKTIQFSGVGFAYGDRGQAAVSGLDFRIMRGSRVALVGPTGSGKSTTADLLMGLLEPTEGEIAVDGVILDESNRQAWRSNIAHVPQILFLADATIAENIALSREVDLSRVRDAASLAQLDRFIESLPNGYQTSVGERGARISGGQRQRLAIARAIYKDSPLLVLDEATSALDDETEAAVLSALNSLQDDGRTIVIIAHRSRLIERCDSVIRLENGRIVEMAERA
jgi:ABC-type multidrug transport system fused ATPase/permease subunit